jgi:hypothetical protein
MSRIAAWHVSPEVTIGTTAALRAKTAFILQFIEKLFSKRPRTSEQDPAPQWREFAESGSSERTGRLVCGI